MIGCGSAYTAITFEAVVESSIASYTCTCSLMDCHTAYSLRVSGFPGSEVTMCAWGFRPRSHVPAQRQLSAPARGGGGCGWLNTVRTLAANSVANCGNAPGAARCPARSPVDA